MAAQHSSGGTGQNLSKIPISPGDSISRVAFSPEPGSPFFCVASWDCKGYIYQADQGSLRHKYQANFPVTDCGWLDGSKTVFTCLDARLAIMDANTGTVVAQADRAHENGIAKFSRVDQHCIVTGSWDKKVKMWDTRTMKNIATGNVGAKVFCMDVTPQNAAAAAGPRLVVGGSDKSIHIFDIRAGFSRSEERESSLKYQLRAIACMPDGQGFVQGSVEGRASWDYFETDMQKNKFAFKCHRDNNPVTGIETIYPVNGIAFHPRYGTFATVGGDGTLCMWDGGVKKRIWKTSRFEAELSALSFSSDGRYLAMAMGSVQENKPPYEIWIKTLLDAEVQPRSGTGRGRG